MGIASSLLRASNDDDEDEDDYAYESFVLEDVEVALDRDINSWTIANISLIDSILLVSGKSDDINAEINLLEEHNLSSEKASGHFELRAVSETKHLRVKANSHEEAQKWLKIIKYHIMINNKSCDVFTTRMLEMTEQFHDPQLSSPRSVMSDEEINEVSIPQITPIQPPPLTIVILVVGTRGDVQPFVYFGQQLLRDGHRVRLATHAEYRSDVMKCGLEFYPLAGDPRKLSEYMVKTGGRLIPDLLNRQERLELPEKMQMLKEICFSCYSACTADDPEDPNNQPFTAEAIISNPVSYGHIHCAQALKIPLHIMFPQPWYPTKCFPHPLSNLSLDSVWGLKNYYSYLMVDEFMWLGLGGMINEFRRKILKLPAIRIGEHPESLLNHWRVPISHMWSPAFVPPCKDWPPHVDVVGEFRSLIEDTSTSSYIPSPELAVFLTEGDRPVYIGFGSMVIEDPTRLVSIILEAAKETGYRILLQSGWTKYGADYEKLSEEVMVIGAMPHDYLFTQVSAVVHHGGAGTTSAGLRAGNPTFICPFFGDQHFWSEMVYRAGAGPKGCPVKDLTVTKLIESLHTLRDPIAIEKTKALGMIMHEEKGVLRGVESFYRNLPLDSMICNVSIFDGQKSRIAKVHCVDCDLNMCTEVDEVIHRNSCERASHIRTPFAAKVWGYRSESTKSSLNKSHFIYSNYDLNISKSIMKCKVHFLRGSLTGIFQKTTDISNPPSPSISKSQKSVDIVNLTQSEAAIEEAYQKAITFQALWNKLSVDGNDAVDTEDLAAFYPSRAEAEAVMALADWSGDHSLSFTELAWVLSQNPKGSPSSL